MTLDLQQLGWKPVFQQQLLQYDPSLIPVRVIAVQRTGLSVAPVADQVVDVPLGGRWFVQDVEDRPTVGDWVLMDAKTGALEHVLERTSSIKRLSPGGGGEVQMIAANIDIAFLVTSCNADFSAARLERYLSVVLGDQIQPVVVLTKADLCDNVDPFVDAVRALGSEIPVEAVNTLQFESLGGLVPWCGLGQSIALLGSSGVGKSTLVNTLMGDQVQQTRAAREDDDKGRHTTTHRSMHVLPQGAIILDSPGMREFQIAEADAGVSEVFADIEELAAYCRFSDCAHQGEPGCEVAKAIDNGDLDERRLESFFKLQRESLYNTETIAQRHARAREFNKKVREAAAKRKQR